jgi:hypothetical protein
MSEAKTDKTDRTPRTPDEVHTKNEWGIPDWRDAQAYGDVKQWTFNRWRWEFYRRRDDLRAFFDRWADESFSRNLRCNEGKTPSEPGFLAFGSGNEEGDAVRLFDYGGVPNPRIGNQPAIFIMPVDQFIHKFRFYNPVKSHPRGLSIMEALGKKQPKIYELRLQDHEYAIKFDLNKPLRSQVDEALELMKAAQIKLHGKPLQRKHHTAKWLGYLRTLDARAANATWSDISSLHPKTAQTEQTARDIWRAADGLRINF